MVNGLGFTVIRLLFRIAVGVIRISLLGLGTLVSVFGIRVGLLMTLSASSGEPLCNGTMSVRPSVCLSVLSIDRSRDVQLLYRYLPAAPERSSERAASTLRSEQDRHGLVQYTESVLR